MNTAYFLQWCHWFPWHFFVTAHWLEPKSLTILVNHTESWWVKAASDNILHITEMSPLNRSRAFLTEAIFQISSLWDDSCSWQETFRVTISQDTHKIMIFCSKSLLKCLKIFGPSQYTRNLERAACLEGLNYFWFNLNSEIQRWKHVVRRKRPQPFHTSEQAQVEFKVSFCRVLSISELLSSCWKVGL